MRVLMECDENSSYKHSIDVVNQLEKARAYLSLQRCGRPAQVSRRSRSQKRRTNESSLQASVQSIFRGFPPAST